jgi:lipopolysaccharide export LptBFGC system permease protein LptF
MASQIVYSTKILYLAFKYLNCFLAIVFALLAMFLHTDSNQQKVGVVSRGGFGGPT